MLRKTKSTNSVKPKGHGKNNSKKSMVNLRQLPTTKSSRVKSFSNVQSIVAIKVGQKKPIACMKLEGENQRMRQELQEIQKAVEEDKNKIRGMIREISLSKRKSVNVEKQKNHDECLASLTRELYQKRLERQSLENEKRKWIGQKKDKQNKYQELIKDISMLKHMSR